ncbi:toxin ParE1/3/4 [Lachnospiraceae bacterium PM6-15]|uniref:type II toxin-antitoxin system RelE/ParE family toxin n=1 Tax=Ohessyouella blattaphilus TaxID=2949333 RepID=UPI003E31B7EB
MIFKIRLSDQADIDLRNIYKYIAYELQSPENATEQIRRLEESMIGLEQMPDRFRRYENEPWLSRGLRIRPVDNYSVLYIVDDVESTVVIIRVMYAGRDIDTQLNIYTRQ